MPTYPYRCVCGHYVEEYRRMEERDNAPEHCGKPMAREIAQTMVSVDYPAYRAVAADKESGKRPWIEGKKQHKEFLKRNNYEPAE